MKTSAFTIFLWFGIFSCSFAQHLQRRPFLGVQVSPVPDSVAGTTQLGSTDGAYVQRVIPGSTAAGLKIQAGDVIARVNNTPVKNYLDVSAMAREFKTGEYLPLVLARGGKNTTVKGKVQPMPFESDPRAEVQYGEVPLGHNRYARSILKMPQGKGRYPSVFFIQGFCCGRLDNLPEQDTQWKLIAGLVGKGYAVFRMNKPGAGESQGSKPCIEIGYKEELAAFASYQPEQQSRYDTDPLYCNALRYSRFSRWFLKVYLTGIVCRAVSGSGIRFPAAS